MLNKLNRLLFPIGDGLEGGELHLHTDTGSGFDNGVDAVAADEGDVDAAGGDEAVAGLEAVAVGGFLLGSVTLRFDEEEIEHGDHRHNHDGGLPAVGDVE